MRKLWLIAASVICLYGASRALADVNYTQGAGTVIFDFICFTTKHCTTHVNINSAGTEIMTSANPGNVAVPSWAGGTLGAMANYGTSPGAVQVPGVNAFVTNTNANGAASIANSSPVTTATINVTPTNCSGTIASGTVAQNAITASASLHGFTLQNIDTTAENLCFNLTGTATVNGVNSFCLQPATASVQGGSYTTPVGFGVNTNVSVIATTTSHKYSCMQW